MERPLCSNQGHPEALPAGSTVGHILVFWILKCTDGEKPPQKLFNTKANNVHGRSTGLRGGGGNGSRMAQALMFPSPETPTGFVCHLGSFQPQMGGVQAKTAPA